MLQMRSRRRGCLGASRKMLATPDLGRSPVLQPKQLVRVSSGLSDSDPYNDQVP